MGIIVYRLFSSSKDCWHLLSLVMEAFFLPAFFPHINSLIHSVLSGHAGDLLAVFYWVQHMQVTTVCFGGTHKGFEGGFLDCSDHCSCDVLVHSYGVSHASWTGHPGQSIHIDICLSCSIMQPEGQVIWVNLGMNCW